jgi:futalosine hydrolase
MRMLVAAATAMEIAPFVAKLGGAAALGPCLSRYVRAPHQIDVLVTGVGMVASAAWCSRTLAKTRYDLALNLGVCGAFDRGLALGQAVHVVADRIAELGAEAGDRFLTIHDLGLLGENESPFTGGELLNASPPQNAELGRLPAVRGITVNTVHGNAHSIGDATSRFRPDVESMEGAAFMYACLTQGLPFAQVRAVSNYVEPRDRSAWKLTEAVDSLARTALGIVEDA